MPRQKQRVSFGGVRTELENRILESDFNARSHARVNRNLSREEQRALENFREYDDIVIKEADKGSEVVIMDKDRYIAEGMHQFTNRQVYIPVSEDPIEEMRMKVSTAVAKLGEDGFTDDEPLDYLSPTGDLKAGRFYLLLKLHKKGCPGRPVISGCSTSTKRIWQFVHSLIPSVKSYVKDTNDLLRKLMQIGRLPFAAILVTIDVVGYIPTYPHEEGLLAIREALNKRISPEIPSEKKVEVVELVLKNKIQWT